MFVYQKKKLDKRKKVAKRRKNSQLCATSTAEKCEVQKRVIGIRSLTRLFLQEAATKYL
jgi:hypothetical protein